MYSSPAGNHLCRGSWAHYISRAHAVPFTNRPLLPPYHHQRRNGWSLYHWYSAWRPCISWWLQTSRTAGGGFYFNGIHRRYPLIPAPATTSPLGRRLYSIRPAYVRNLSTLPHLKDLEFAHRGGLFDPVPIGGFALLEDLIITMDSENARNILNARPPRLSSLTAEDVKSKSQLMSTSQVHSYLKSWYRCITILAYRPPYQGSFYLHAPKP